MDNESLLESLSGLGRDLHDARARLHELKNQREALMLEAIENGFKYREVAELLNCTINTVTPSVSRARKRRDANT